MPCSDVTERIQVTLDAADRLASYQLNKRTCGRGVGEDELLMDQLRDMPVDELLAIDPGAFSDEVSSTYTDETVQFVYMKHLIAVQAALYVYTGREAGDKDEVCTVAEVSFDGTETFIDADISVDVATRKIRSCGATGGGCGSCG